MATAGREPNAAPMRIALATRNGGKIREILAICADWPVAWVTDGSRGWPHVEETGPGYLDNARLKAHAVAAFTRLPAIADDSGIEVDALSGGPGPLSARFAGPDASDADNLRLLIERITPVPPHDRTAAYRCVAVCAWPDGREACAEATCSGLLVSEPRGERGFGYDPIFVPEEELVAGAARTMAELSPAEKDAISHRGRAFRALRDRLFGPPIAG